MDALRRIEDGESQGMCVGGGRRKSNFMTMSDSEGKRQDMIVARRVWEGLRLGPMEDEQGGCGRAVRRGAPNYPHLFVSNKLVSSG